MEKGKLRMTVEGGEPTFAEPMVNGEVAPITAIPDGNFLVARGDAQ